MNYDNRCFLQGAKGDDKKVAQKKEAIKEEVAAVSTEGCRYTWCLAFVKKAVGIRVCSLMLVLQNVVDMNALLY